MIGTIRTRLLGAIVILLVVAAFFYSCHLERHIECVRATISWHEVLERDDMPCEPRPPITIEDAIAVKKLYDAFSSKKSEQETPAGWSSSVNIKFDFSCGHSEHVLIDNELAIWTGLGASGDMRVPSGFAKIFAREFGIPFDTPQGQ